MTNRILVLEHAEYPPMACEIDFTDFAADIPWDQVDPETRAIMEARVARGDGLIPLGVDRCESATHTDGEIVVKTELWFAYSGDDYHNYI